MGEGDKSCHIFLSSLNELKIVKQTGQDGAAGSFSIFLGGGLFGQLLQET